MSRTEPTPQALARQAEMLGNRVKKTFDRLKGVMSREAVDCFRLYDRDIPEIRAVVDWYAGHVVVGEYSRTLTEQWPEWLPAMTEAVGAALGVPQQQRHCKVRRTGDRGERYERLDRQEHRVQVREGSAKLLVNLDDYLDTGLFSDHRKTRKLVAAETIGKHFLNLFCYTGAFSVAAAVAGAKATTSVDASGRYLQWLRDNLACNGLDQNQLGNALPPKVFHETVRADTRDFLRLALRNGQSWDVIFCDPPSYSARPDAPPWEVQRDHRELVLTCLQVLKPGGTLWFSSNHQRFFPDLQELPGYVAVEMTERTVPVDYRNKQVHRVWRIAAGPLVGETAAVAPT